MKRCSRCRKEFPKNTDYFSRNKSKKDGFDHYCKLCVKNYQKEFKSRPKKQREILDEGYIRCTKCKIVFPATIEFMSTNRSRKSGLDSWCKECRKEYARAIYWRNPKKNNLKSAEYYENNKHKILPKSRIRASEWAKNNSQKLRFRANASTHKRRAHKLNNGGSFTKEDIARLYILQYGICRYCDNYLTTKFTIDHMIPLSRGGDNYPNNLALTCSFCNYSKHDKTLTEYIEWKNKFKLM